jgi:large subunit ribosomal protein L10
VKDEGNLLPFGSDLDDPVCAKAQAGGQGVKRRPAVVRRWVSIDDLSGTAGINPAASVRERTANRRELVDRTAKSELVTTLGEVFKATKVVVVAHYSGLTVAQMQTLRRQMKQAGASVKVAKNRLAKIALEGSDVASIGSLLKGPALIAYSGDPIAAPKVAVDFAKTHEQFVILGGAMGTTALDPNGVKALAALPSLDELRAKIVGLLVAPATKIAQVVNAPAAKVARVVQAYAAKSEEGAAA